MQWKLNLLLWPRDQDTEFTVEACWLSQTQDGQTDQIHPQTFDDPFFWQHWHYLHALGSHSTGSQQGILCWGFKRVQEEIPFEESSTLPIGSVVISTRTMHQSITPSLSQTIWPRWASRQFVTVPIVQTLLPVTFGYSLSSEAVVMRQLRRWKRLWHAHTRGLPWGLEEVAGTVQQVHCSRKEITSKGARVSCVYYQ